VIQDYNPKVLKMTLKTVLFIIFAGLPVFTLGILLVELLPEITQEITQGEDIIVELLAFLVIPFVYLPFALPATISYLRAKKKYNVYASVTKGLSKEDINLVTDAICPQCKGIFPKGRTLCSDCGATLIK
jgi:hypothetical protein